MPTVKAFWAAGRAQRAVAAWLGQALPYTPWMPRQGSQWQLMSSSKGKLLFWKQTPKHCLHLSPSLHIWASVEAGDLLFPASFYADMLWHSSPCIPFWRGLVCQWFICHRYCENISLNASSPALYWMWKLFTQRERFPKQCLYYLQGYPSKLREKQKIHS